jgi:hypothetical protein
LQANSATRNWIKKTELDKAAGVEWDGTLAQMILNFPEYVIPEKGRKPPRVPSLLAIHDGSELYSIETYGMLLQYAAEYIRRSPLSPQQTEACISFKVNLDRAINKAAKKRSIDFLGDEQTKEDYNLFNRILNLKDFREGQDPVSSVAKMGDLVPAQGRPIRWFSRGGRGGSITS